MNNPITPHDILLEQQKEIERLRAFVQKIARFLKDGEKGFEADPTDSMMVLDQLTDEARALTSVSRTGEKQ